MKQEKTMNAFQSPSIVINLPPAALAAVSAPRPEWVRIPGAGENCPHTGITRAGYYRLIRAGEVETKKLGQGRGGVCLVRYASLLAAIEGAGSAPAAAAASSPGLPAGPSLPLPLPVEPAALIPA